MLKEALFLMKTWQPRKNCVPSHPYLPIKSTSLQRPLSLVAKVAIIEKLDCILVFVIVAYRRYHLLHF